MKNRLKNLGLPILIIFIISVIPHSYILSQEKKIVTDGEYAYEMVENDPLNARIYTLNNGLKVYMFVNKDAPRIQTYIAVATGSKNDPHDAQGLSHYLEHMVFKGTDKFGTKDYAQEKPLIDTIIAMYERRRLMTDPEERKAIYHKIDSVSYIASEFAIANEYDKMIADIGGAGSNAYTSVEQTVYIADIPSNQLEKWLTIEAERFRKPVMRLFHTELESVYEEKNRGLDNDNTKVWEALLGGLFQNHTYGTQTTIGSVDQLQNPSVQKIIDYYNENYVPNNMAICLSGDLDPEETIRLIDSKFGSFERKEKAPFTYQPENAITTPIISEVLGPAQESVIFGYRSGGADTKDADILIILEYILSNGTAGLIDLNLNQDQKVIDAFASNFINKDYSVFYLGGNPREGQTLEEVKELLLQQLDLLKKGQFPDWLIPAIISNFKLNQIRSYESNENRADAFVTAFVHDIPWEKYIFNVDRLSQITKEDVVNFANQNLNNNYVLVYKRTGEDLTIKKVEKPVISPVSINRDDKSEFVETILSQTSKSIEPAFLDFEKDIRRENLQNGIPVFYLQNKENPVFSLYYIISLGSNQNKKLNLALDYLNYLGTSQFTSSQLKEEFYRYASSFSVGASEDETTIHLSGLNENFDASLKLLEELFSDPKVNSDALSNLIADILKQREDAKLSKRTILWSGMVNYAKYGKDNPFTYRLSEEELMKIRPEELTAIIKNLFSYDQRVLYYGPSGSSELTSALNTFHKTPSTLTTSAIQNKFVEKSIDENLVYVVNYDMQQAEIVMISKSESFDKNKAALISLYNEYFGGGMGSVVFQDLRESKALAYSTFSTYQIPNRKDKSSYNVSYIGSQADKLPEAIAGMSGLLNDIPQSEIIFNNSKNSLIKQLQSERISRENILFEFERLKKLGIDYDIRKEIYNSIPAYGLQDITQFQNNFVKGKNYVLMVLGDVKKLDMKTLEKYGKIKVLTLEEVFGY